MCVWMLWVLISRMACGTSDSRSIFLTTWFFCNLYPPKTNSLDCFHILLSASRYLWLSFSFHSLSCVISESLFSESMRYPKFFCKYFVRVVRASIYLTNDELCETHHTSSEYVCCICLFLPPIYVCVCLSFAFVFKKNNITCHDLRLCAFSLVLQANQMYAFAFRLSFDGPELRIEVTECSSKCHMNDMWRYSSQSCSCYQQKILRLCNKLLYFIITFSLPTESLALISSPVAGEFL